MITSKNYRNEFYNAMRKRKANDTILSEGFDSGSRSYEFPNTADSEYAASLSQENLFRRLATVFQTPTKEGTIQMVASTANAAIVDEANAYPEDNDTFDKASFSAYKVAAISKLGNTFVEDSHFDIEKYLSKEFARRFGRAEEDVLINGIGIKEPTGILASAEIGIETSADLNYDSVITLYFATKPEYRKNGVWLMNDETALILRKLKDSDGNYLWNQANDTILSKPVVISNYMPSCASGPTPIAFGDLSYYWILERQPLSVKVLSELYARENRTGYAAFERIDGKLIRPEAVKLLKLN